MAIDKPVEPRGDGLKNLVAQELLEWAGRLDGFDDVESAGDEADRILALTSPARTDGMDAELVAKLLDVRDALIRKDIDEAYHELYSIADPTFTKQNPWEKWEALRPPAHPTQQGDEPEEEV